MTNLIGARSINLITSIKDGFSLRYFCTIASDRVVLVPSIPSSTLYRIVGLSLRWLVVLLSRVFVCARDHLMMLPSVTVHDFTLL